MESYYEELDEIGAFHFEDEGDGYEFDEDEY
jgi:hypothetical protein